MNESSNSDSDFWQSFNENPILSFSHKKPQENNLSLENDNPEPPRPNSQIPNKKPEITQKQLKLWDFDKQKSTFERLRNSGLQRLTEERIRAENLTIKEALPEIKEFHYALEKKFLGMNEEIMRMHEELIRINRDNECLKDKIKSQRLVASISERQPKKVKIFYITPDNSNLLKNLKILEPQVVCLREVLGACKKESIRGKETVNKLEEELLVIQNNHKVHTEKLEKSYMEQESVILKESKDLREKFEEYKEKSEKEIEIRDIVYKRQQAFIEKLWEDLGTSKFIFNNPTLRVSFLNRSRDSESQSRCASPALVLSQRRAGMQSRLTKNTDYTEMTTLPQSRPVTRERRYTKLRISEDLESSLSIQRITTKRSSTPYR
ncbi:hypothetical protein SteCoe_17951 [Stentor coeruleus]|uniref:Uncharacterized protein n=1 Tax=Stentor coeruleus TaxID=5963 RepID=A0A1R2BY41_9CILI|nr:hypothetical protein SteCoe_17951 [Stentor coeruleus]